MSNAEVLQQNNLRLSDNNGDLNSILETINNLPNEVKINLQEKSLIPTTEKQEVIADEGYTGLSKVTVEKIVENSIEITPSSEEQNFNGVYTDITVAGDEDLKPENIKEGTSIFGVEGIAEGKSLNIEGYTHLEYIESTGTQYIDTGYTPKSDDIYKVTIKDASVLDTPIFGATSTWRSGSILFTLWNTTAGAKYYYTWWYSNTIADNKRLVSDLNDMKIEVELNKGNAIVNDKQTIVDNSINTNLVIDDTLKIFGGIANKYGSFKLYGFKVYNSNKVLQLDLIPVKRIADNKVGLYDKVNNIFYDNLGTGEFITGKELKYVENLKIKLQQKTVIPSSEELNVVVDSDYDALSKVTVEGEEDLKPENIKKGVSLFGVEGNVVSSNVKITDAYYLCYKDTRIDYAQELVDICENIKDAQFMFYQCSNLKEINVSQLDTSNVTNMQSMFYRCSSLTELDVSNFNTFNVTNMQNMFYECSGVTELDVSNFNTSNVTNMSNMFYRCLSLTELDVSNFNTSNVTNMSNMFYYLYQLTELDVSNFNTSNVTNMQNMFFSCSGVTELDVSNFDASKVTNIYSFLANDSKLINLKFMNNLGKGYTQKTNNYSNYRLEINQCSYLTHESLMSVINNLYDLNLTYDVANGGKLYTQQLVLGSKNLAKLTSEEINIAVSKGWSVS